MTMILKKIEVSNFKSFQNAAVDLNKFNVLIGANASGKSSFIQILKFVKDIRTEGLENAISLQGGVDYLRNNKIGSSEPFRIHLNYDGTNRLHFPFLDMRDFDTVGTSIDYKFSIEFSKRKNNFKVVEDKMLFDFLINSVEQDKQSKPSRKKIGIGKYEIDFSGVKRTATITLPEQLHDSEIAKESNSPFLRYNEPGTILEQKYFLPYFTDVFSSTSFFDIDPKLPKKAVPISGKADLEFDANNLAIVLRNIIAQPENKKTFNNLISDLLPFVENIAVDSLADKSFLFKMQEAFCNSTYLPASLLSDGTIIITAMIIALYFQNPNSFTIIEEPERNLHPSLISKLVAMMKDVSTHKQLLVTTHNLEVIKNCDINDLIFISRNKEGFSDIKRPSETEYVKKFLENELGIDELFLQNILG
jgi:predicted ATPase